MKTLLVPTDFSETATNAIHYAAELATYTKSKLVLFHAYHVPIMVSEAPVMLNDEDFQLKERSDEQLSTIAESLKKTHGTNLEVACLSTPGFASEEIATMSEIIKCDLIIMGTHGANGLNKFLGSNASTVIKQTHCHVLVIPNDVTFQQIDKIVFAYDYLEIRNKKTLTILHELASLFNSEVFIFNNIEKHLPEALDKQLAASKMENELLTIKHTYSFSENTNLIDAINQFTTHNNAKMVTMIKRHHTLIDQLFTKSNTKQMALHTKFPLLILHE
jgi:nucleotide-binding universal stress UspA family protein